MICPGWASRRRFGRVPHVSRVILTCFPLSNESIILLLEIHMPSIQISDFLYAEASAVAQRHGVDPDQVIEQWAMAGMVAPIVNDQQFREAVQASLDDPRPSIPHVQVMAEVQQILDSKVGAVQSMHQFMDEAPATGAAVDIKKLIEDGRS